VSTATSTLLSAIVPVGPNAADLSQIQKTFISAKHLSIEIIIIFDNAPAEAESILRTWCQENRIPAKFISGNFGGPGNARNQGLAICTGEWIVFWDSDDFAYVENLITAINESEKSGKNVLIGRYEIQLDDLVQFERIGDYSKYPPKKRISFWAMNPGIWRCAFKRENVKSEFPNLSLAEDQVFLGENQFASEDICWTNLVLYRYFETSPQSLTKDLSLRPDLNKSVLVLMDEKLNCTSDLNRRFLAVMIVRQQLTIIKSQPWVNKLSAISSVIRIILSDVGIIAIFFAYGTRRWIS